MAKFIFGKALYNKIKHRKRLCKAIWTVEWLLLSGLLGIMRCLPLDFASALGSRLATTLGPYSRRHAVFEENIRKALPAQPPQARKKIVKAMWSNAGRVFAEFPHLQKIVSQRVRINVIGDLKPNAGTVFVGAHYCNWQVSLAIALKHVQSLYCLYSPIANQKIEWLLNHYRAPLGAHYLPTTTCIKKLMRYLDENKSLAFAIDQRIHPNGTPIPFFDMEKPSALLPARLALRPQCDLIPLQVTRTHNGHYHITVHPAIKPTASATTDKEKAIDMITQVHRLFATWIEANSGDWFCPKRCWPVKC